VPKSSHGLPVRESSATMRASMGATKMRRRHAAPAGAAGSSHVDTPRFVKSPYCPERSSCESNDHNSFPVSPSMARTPPNGVEA
jgi:hypothetical protein